MGDPGDAASAPSMTVDRRARLGHLGEDRRRVLGQLAAGRRQLDALPRPLQQPHAELGFKPGYLL